MADSKDINFSDSCLMKNKLRYIFKFKNNCRNKYYKKVKFT